MSTAIQLTEKDVNVNLAEALDEGAKSVLDHAVDAHHRGLKVYQSLQNLNEVIGTEYGDRVLYELIQNAHDAHPPGDMGRIAINLIIRSNTEGVLYIANGGTGFRMEDVEGVKNLASSGKEVGEGIGNKGLGFRSIEALTDDVRIFSRLGTSPTQRFNGFCFRFAQAEEIEAILASRGGDPQVCVEVANTVPRYLVPRPLEDQSTEVMAYAKQGFATVIVVPLRTEAAVELARKQVKMIADLDAPLLLFLDRIAEVRIDIEAPGQQAYRRRLHRRQTKLGNVASLPGTGLHEVDLGDGHRFLVVRREVELERIQNAVERSIPTVPQLKRWLKWKGIPTVSIAVELSQKTIVKGRLYNFLPMSDAAVSPIMGYLDAPFFSDIDRRNADFKIPLNEALMEMSAETCAAATLSIVESGLSVPPGAVFDLFAWTGKFAEMFDKALKTFGSSLQEALVIPVIPSPNQKSWCAIPAVNVWSDAPFKLLNAKGLAKYVGVALVSSDLTTLQLERLNQVARRVPHTLVPPNDKLAKWAEAFARSLLERKVGPRTWCAFYDDLILLFKGSIANLRHLECKEILLDRSHKLRPAGGRNSSDNRAVFVRRDASQSKSKNKGVPLPPASLARRYNFLDERINLRRETREMLIQADLVREYDPIGAMQGLKDVLGANADIKRREEALAWVFQVWRAAGTPVEQILRKADLHVPTMSGWRPAKNTAFSSSWSSTGRVLENYLTETMESSPDCRRARDLLIVSQQDWPIPLENVKKQWASFLEVLGVSDGLRVTQAHFQRTGSPAYHWNQILHSGSAVEGLDQDWCSEVSTVKFNYPYTDYQMRGEAWRLPGQVEYTLLTEGAREALCTLAFMHLKTHNKNYLQFEVGRFDRGEREWDRRWLPTPLAVFLRKKAWLVVNSQEGIAFRRPQECWAARQRRFAPPRFVDRLQEGIVEFADGTDFANLAFSSTLGLRDWQDPSSAIDRLEDLARLAPTLSSNDRTALRREYHRAWREVAEAEDKLPDDLGLVVLRHGKHEVLQGGAHKPTVVVTEEAQKFEARVLSSAGQAVLEVGQTLADKVTTLLLATDAYSPRRLDGVGVQLLIDGRHFLPRADDPPITEFGLEWLPEIILVGHEVLGESLERGIQSSTIERRSRAIRVRWCETISLLVDDMELSSMEKLQWYAFEHDDFPTLIIVNGMTLNWTNLARSLSNVIARLIDVRLRFIEKLFLRLALELNTTELAPPSDEQLARALECDVAVVQDIRAALRTNLEHLRYVLVPLVAYHGGIELARQLETDIERKGSRFNARAWLANHFSDTSVLIETCERATNRNELYKTLGLNFEKFNRVLLELGELPLSNEADLRQSYGAYLQSMKLEIIDRLRRRYIVDFRSGHDLKPYEEYKSLDFLSFDDGWILTRESLDNEVVKTHVSRLLSAVLGEDTTEKLPSLKSVVEANRKSVREFALEVINVIRAWCRQNNVSLPGVWQQGDPQAVARHIENRGLFDFEVIEQQALPSLCVRADCWPIGMPTSLDESKLGINKDEVAEEEKRREEERTQKDVARRSIEFAGTLLDTGNPTFADTIEEMAKNWLAKDDSWFQRSSQRIKLVELSETGQAKGSNSGGNGGGVRRERQLTDAQRQAMGLASEWLAFQFLIRRHKGCVDETCWISENRAHFFGGTEGDDAAGYDFLVKTPNVEWLYEVKSSLEYSGEFELTANELRVAGGAAKDGRRRYRVLYVPFVFSPDRWCVLELPNPMGETTRNRYSVVGRGSLRLRFQCQ